MDLHRLEVFCKVIELKSFTKAAAASYLSQPTVSEHIRSLEETLNEKLIDRLGREALPTQAGRILYKYARKMLLLRDETLQAIESYSGKLSGHLSIGAGTIPGTYILPELIGSFKRKYPAILITLKITSSRLTAEMVRKGDLEIGVVGARWNDASLEWKKIFADELVLTVYPEHPWAQKKSISPDELAAEPFIFRERGSGTQKVMEEILADHGFDVSRLTVVAEMGTTEAVRQSIKARIGIGILSQEAVADDIDRGKLVAVPIDGVTFHRPFYLVQRKKRDLSPICSAFLDFLESAGNRASI